MKLRFPIRHPEVSDTFWINSKALSTLLTDGYVAYQRYAEKTTQIMHATCWVHTRRTFLKAESMEPEAVAEAL